MGKLHFEVAFGPNDTFEVIEVDAEGIPQTLRVMTRQEFEAWTFRTPPNKE